MSYLRTTTLAVASVAFLAAANDATRWWSFVQYLASDAMEGRNTGSDGHRKAAEYVAAQFQHGP